MMSMVSELVKKLRKYANAYGGYFRIREIDGTDELLRQAADTIEALSAKLAAANMNRSERYYSGGWIPVEERLPEEDDRVILCTKHGIVKEGEYTGRYGCAMRKGFFAEDCFEDIWHVSAWMPLPEPYRPSDEQPKDSQGI